MNTKPLNILLADDDTDDCIFFKKALEELQLSTNLTIVYDGEQLMQLLTKETNELPHVLFLDINMPRKNGFECLSEIKTNNRLKALPVVMFSTSYSQDKVSLLFKIGAHVYIHKPGDFAQLIQVIHHALNMATEKKLSTNQLKYILNA
jgi:CheY-like chemotaxis protein